MSFIAGQYTVQWNSGTIGQVKDGVTLHTTTYKELIQGDYLARAAQDAVFQGIDVTSDFALMEWDVAQAINLFWPYGAMGGAKTGWLTCAVVGRLDVQQSLAKALLLTAVTGTAAGVLASPAAVSLQSSILHEDMPVDHVFAPKHRVVPVRMRHYPSYGTAGVSPVLYGTVT